MNSLKLWTQCCLKNHPSHFQKKRCVVILTCRVIFPKYHRIKVNKKKCQNVVNNYQARVILRPIPKCEWICIFPSHDFRSFLPCQLYNSSNLSRPPVHIWPSTKSLDFNQKIRRKIAPSFQPFQATLVDPGRHSDLHHTSCYLVSDGTRGSWMFFSPWWSFVKERIWEKGTPSQMGYLHPRKMNEWGWVGGLLARRLSQL